MFNHSPINHMRFRIGIIVIATLCNLLLSVLAHATSNDIQQPKLLTHEETLYSCEDGHLFTHTYLWDEITSPNIELDRLINEQTKKAEIKKKQRVL